MFLRSPSWADDSLRAASSSASSTTTLGGSQSPIVDLMLSLTNQRLYREVSLSLRTGLRDAKAEFAFMRIKGLKSLTRFLTSAVKSEKIVELFLDAQKYRELQGSRITLKGETAQHYPIKRSCWSNQPVWLCSASFENKPQPHRHWLEAFSFAPWKLVYKQLFEGNSWVLHCAVVPVLFEHTLAPSRSEGNPIVVGAPSSNEIGLALRILEGCCLLDTGSRQFASRYSAPKVLMALLLSGEPPEQTACLDALLAVLLDSTSNQKEFERLHGVRKIAEVVKSASVDDGVRLKCAEFLLLLIGHVLPANERPANGFQHAEGRKGVATFEGARQDVIDILGRRCSEVLDVMTSRELANLDFDKEQTSVRTLSQRLVELS